MTSQLPPAWPKRQTIGPQPNARPAPGIQIEQEMLDRAATYREHGQIREAEQLCIKVLTANPRNPQALFLSGTLALDLDDTELAVLLLNRALNEKPDDPYYHLALAATHQRINEFEVAARHFHRALALKPDLVGAFCGLGANYVKSGKAELALPLYEEALKIDRDHKAAAVGYADALISLGRSDEALPYLKDAIAQRKFAPLAYSIFADTRTFTTEPAELRSILADLADPRLPPAEASHLHHAAGKILNDLKRYGEAVDQFQKAKNLAGHDFDIEAYRGWVDSMIDLFSPALLKAKAGLGEPSEVPSSSLACHDPGRRSPSRFAPAIRTSTARESSPSLRAPRSQSVIPSNRWPPSANRSPT